MLRSCHSFDVHRVVEVAQVFVGLADAVVLGPVAILYVCHAPCVVANELEGARSLTFLVALKAHIVVLHGFAPPVGQVV